MATPEPEASPKPPEKVPRPPDEYRAELLEVAKESVRNWDKYVLTLSGGALAVSFAFVKDIVSPEKMVRIDLLFYAWVLWLASIGATLLSFYVSYCSHMKAVRQIEAGTVYAERPGGWWDRAIAVLNPSSGILFIFGVVLIALFARFNLGNAAAGTPAMPGVLLGSNVVVYQTNIVSVITTTVTAQTNK